MVEREEEKAIELEGFDILFLLSTEHEIQSEKSHCYILWHRYYPVKLILRNIDKAQQFSQAMIIHPFSQLELCAARLKGNKIKF